MESKLLSLVVQIIIIIINGGFMLNDFFKCFLPSRNEVVGYSNMAFPEGGDDNISQHMGSTVHDDDFQEALNMISDDIEKTKEAQVS